MAQSYSQLVARLDSAEFQDQCRWAVVDLMRVIALESDQTANHAERLLFMKAAMANHSAVARSASAFVISAPSCIGDTPPTDAQVKTALEQVIPRYYALV